MSTVQIEERHSLGLARAQEALRAFENDVAKYGMKLLWSGARGQLKGTGASGTIEVSDASVRVEVKLGLLAKVAGIDPNRVRASIEKRLTAALSPAAAD